jgi:DNA mismatch endonuclease (patch repair protein)
MPDNLTPEQRRKTMAAVKGKDTSLEKVLRAAFLARRWRFKCHVNTLPGNPDIVFGRARLVVFVDGDFWHGWRFPAWKANIPQYWQRKIERNRNRDRRNVRRLRRLGWRVVRIWGHQVQSDLSRVVESVAILLGTAESGTNSNDRRKPATCVGSKRSRSHD